MRNLKYLKMEDKVCIISYNSRGFGDCKKEFVRDLMNVAGCQAILCNQENFILKNNAYMIMQTLPEHKIIFKEAIKDGFDGRPKNGMFIAIPKSIKAEAIKDVSPESFRIQSVTLEVGTYKLLVVNTYFPTDTKGDFDENELLLLLSDIENVLDRNDFDHVVWTGDINADFRRKTKHVKLIDEFVKKCHALKSWDSYQVDFTHVTEREGSTFTSIIDHFIWDEGFKQHVEDAGVLHVPENMSDHSPVYCKFRMPSYEKIERGTTEKKRETPSWKKATDDEKLSFVSELEIRLNAIDIPASVLCCRDVKCDDRTHKIQVDDVMSQVLSALEETASESTPQVTGCIKKQRIPEWKGDVAPVKDNAHFWHSVWVSAGKPLNNTLHTIMKKTRNQYHLVLRKKKRIIERLKRNKMLNSCIENDGNIFKEIKRMRKCHQAPATTIDDVSDDIPAYMAEKYEKLYNSVDDEANLAELGEEINEMIVGESLEHVDKINSRVMKEATLKLKPGKTDPLINITSDYLINSPDILHQILTVCLKSFIIHGHVSDFLLVSMMIPIIKDKLGDRTSSDNYRSIAISSLVMKIFDLVILSVFEEFLQLDELQFGYQREVSTTMCTWLAVETVSHFLRNGSEVYSCLMDMSKAFDRVQHSHLFQKLLDQGMPAIIVRFILASYKEQRANVNWNGSCSEYFQIGNGVKQGAILSAVLYCVYTNGLFEELRRLKIGCWLGRDYVGVLGYADDLFLLAPTIDGLQDMLKVCERYAGEHNLKFSTNTNPNKSKTKCMAFLNKDRPLRKLKLCGHELPWVEKGKHLGVKVTNDPRSILGDDVMEKRARYIQSNNELMQEFSFTHSRTKAFVNRVFNSHFYGSVLWNLYERESNMLYNTWSVSVRKMFRVDRKTHRYLIEPISRMQHIKSALRSRFIGFMKRLASSRKSVLRHAFKVFSKDCRSTTGANVRNILLESGALLFEQLSMSDIKRIEFHPTPAEEQWRISVINDLIDIRDGMDDDIGWTKDDINETLEYLCTT